jgi:tetratricopeptide (TPR) repeat protein
MIPVYERYIDEHGDDALLETELGVLARQQGDEQAAVRHLRRAIEIDPECDEALSVLGAMTIPSDAASAEALLLRALRANPHNLRARFRLADLQEASGRRREALENLEAAVRSEPFDPGARARLREALERGGKSQGRDAIRPLRRTAVRRDGQPA